MHLSHNERVHLCDFTVCLGLCVFVFQREEWGSFWEVQRFKALLPPPPLEVGTPTLWSLIRGQPKYISHLKQNYITNIGNLKAWLATREWLLWGDKGKRTGSVSWDKDSRLSKNPLCIHFWMFWEMNGLMMGNLTVGTRCSCCKH